LDRILRAMDAGFHRVMLILILSGVVLSCLHQSSLGSLMLIAPGKMDPLWFTPILPLLFLLSAIAVGYPMVIFEALLSARAFRRRPEMHVLSPLARFTPVFLGVYLAFKLSDLAIRGTMSRAFDGSAPSTLFLVEITGGVMLPLVLLLSERIRRSPRGLLLAALLAIAGVVLNRVNVFLTAYTPVYPAERYVPSLGEFAVSAGLVAALVLVNRIVVRVFPVLPAAPQRGTS
jgi:Ni/Fe-hydrogenase subunit HybB-like protein